METLLGTKFAVRKILLLMISGIFLVGCAYQTSAIPIDFGIESRTDLNGADLLCGGKKEEHYDKDRSCCDAE